MLSYLMSFYFNLPRFPCKPISFSNKKLLFAEVSAEPFTHPARVESAVFRPPRGARLWGLPETDPRWGQGSVLSRLPLWCPGSQTRGVASKEGPHRRRPEVRCVGQRPFPRRRGTGAPAPPGRRASNRGRGGSPKGADAQMNSKRPPKQRVGRGLGPDRRERARPKEKERRRKKKLCPRVRQRAPTSRHRVRIE